jgi:hypothetical protein
MFKGFPYNVFRSHTSVDTRNLYIEDRLANQVLK